jgi:hypothetical protein
VLEILNPGNAESWEFSMLKNVGNAEGGKC